MGISAEQSWGWIPSQMPVSTFPCLGFLLNSSIQKPHARLQTYRNLVDQTEELQRGQPMSHSQQKKGKGEALPETARPHLGPPPPWAHVTKLKGSVYPEAMGSTMGSFLTKSKLFQPHNGSRAKLQWGQTGQVGSLALAVMSDTAAHKKNQISAKIQVVLNSQDTRSRLL